LENQIKRREVEENEVVGACEHVHSRTKTAAAPIPVPMHIEVTSTCYAWLAIVGLSSTMDKPTAHLFP